MKFKTNLKKFIAGLTLSLTAITMIVPSMSVSATPTKNSKAVDDYLFVPTVSGSEALNLLTKADSSDTVTSIDMNSTDNSVTITFPAGSIASETSTVTHTATQLNLDMSTVAEHTHKYVSFDMSVSDMMDFVASMDRTDTTGNVRPLSLYLASNGYMGGMQHSKAAFCANDVVRDAMAEWFKQMGYTLGYEANKTYNIKMVQDIKDGKTWVYIDGIMKGQESYTAPTGTTKYSDFKTDKLTLTHYATGTSKQSVTLKNIEIGDCYDSGLVKPSDSFTLGGSNTEFWTPEYAFKTGSGDARLYGNVYISFTMPTDKWWHLQAGQCAAMWNADEQYGVCSNWSYDNDFKQQSYVSTTKIGNISCYKYTTDTSDEDKIKVTFEFDRNNMLGKVYTDKGGYHEFSYTGSLPPKVILTCDSTDGTNEIAREDIVQEYGEVVPIGLNVKDSKEGVAEAFKTGEKYYITTCNQYEGDETLLYAWYDNNDTLIAADSRVVSNRESNSGGSAICLRNTFTATAPDTAVKLKVYLWNSVSGVKPLCEAKTLTKAVESAE